MMNGRALSLSLLAFVLGLLCACDVAAQVASIPLTDGVPVSGYCSNHFTNPRNYYSIDIPLSLIGTTSNLIINVSPLGDGDVDLYASLTTPNPSWSTPGVYSSVNFGEDSLTIPNAAMQNHATCYITVQGSGWRASNYTIVAQVKAAIQLTDGESQYSFVHFGAYTPFSFQSSTSPAPGDVTFATTATGGQVALYISTSPAPSISNYMWTNRYSSASVVVHSTDTRYPTNGLFYISVFGVSDSNFFVSATTNNTAGILNNGVPRQDTLVSNADEYFTYTVSNDGCMLSVSITPISGDPDLYISMGVTRPNPTACANAPCNISTAYGADTITFDQAQTGVYHIGIHAFSGSVFTVVAQSVCPQDSYNSSATRLVDGVSQHGVLDRNSFRFYSFAVPSSGPDVTISVTNIRGDADLYIRNDDIEPSSSSYQWAAASYGSDSITIHSSDPNACQPNPATQCIYYIQVYAFLASEFNIQASTPGQLVVLSEGTPQGGYLVTGQTQIYVVPVNYMTFVPIIISVTDLGSGNPDIYASVINPTPSSSNYTWRSTRWSSDSINISPQDPNACHGFCTYYVAVVASSTTTYSIVFHTDVPSVLPNGQPTSSLVLPGAYQYFQVRVNPGYQQVSISLIASNGYANMLISNNASQVPMYSMPNSYQYSIPWYRGNQNVLILENSTTACVVNDFGYCTYVIGVQGFSNCSFVITATSGIGIQAIQLVSGIPSFGLATWQTWQYFSFRVDTPGENLDLVLTALTGDPDIYVSTVGKPGRTHGTYNYSGVHSGGDEIFLTNASVGTYWIGVYGFSVSNSSFTMTATLAPPNGTSGIGDLTQLIDGQPQNGLVSGNQYKYYIISVTQAVTLLSISVSRLAGDPDLYVRYDPVSPSVLPDRYNYMWSSSSSGDDQIIRYNPEIGVYTIGVYGFGVQASYVLTARTNSMSGVLVDGVSVSSSVAQHDWQYFVVPMAYSADLTVTVTPLSGDPDLYISTVYDHVNQTTAMWKSTAYSSDSVTIAHNDPNHCFGLNCNYYVGVYGYFASSFSIVASFANEQSLADSQPVDSNVPIGAFKYFSYAVLQYPYPQVPLTLDLVTQAGLASIYVSMIDEPVTTPTPNWQYRQWGSSSGATLVIANVSDACQNTPMFEACEFHIGIHGDMTSNFTLMATMGNGVRNILLQSGKSRIGSVVQNEYKYYTMRVSDNAMDLVVAVTPFAGDCDLYMSQINPHPNSTNHTWQARSAGADSLAVHNSQAGLYYIGVYGFSSCSYSITAYSYYENVTMVPVTLIDGQPQAGVLAGTDFRYYTFIVGPNTPELSITLTNALGDPDLFVTNDGTFPNSTHFQWSSTHYGSDFIAISSPPPGVYTIGVFAFTTSLYTVVASTSNLHLVAGVPFREDLTAGQFEYFYLDVIDTSADLTISVTSFNGDPDLYISDINPQPSFTNNTGSARSYRNDSITIPSSRLHTGPWYIAVQAFSNCTFTIIASYQNQTQLSDGLPQNGAVMKEQGIYYIFRVTPSGRDLSFSLSPFSGYARMYIARDTGEPVYNDPTSYQWSSSNPFTSQLIIVRANDTNACPNSTDPTFFCTYYILVRGVSNCQYSLLAVGSSNSIDVQDGVPQRATVSGSEYVYFRFLVNLQQADVSITVTALSGDPDIFVSTTPNPSSTNYQWKSEYYGGDSILIPYDNPNFVFGEYYIGVYGASYSNFALVASMSPRNGNYSVIHLIDGLPIIGRISHSGNWNYYAFIASDPASTYQFSVTPRYGDPDLYISMAPQFPTTTTFTWGSTNSGSDSLAITGIQAGCDQTGVIPCIFYIGINAWSATMYSISATSGDVTLQLQSGVPISGSIGQGNYRYYSILVVDFGQPQLVISVTATSGDPDVYVSNSTHFPNTTNYNWTGSQPGSESLTIANPSVGMYWIGVYGWSNCSYSITATVGAVTLLPGQPYTDTLTNYYSLRLYELPVFVSQDDLAASNGFTVSINMNTWGSLDMFMISNGSFAGPNMYTWSSSYWDSSNGKVLTVRPGDPNACWNCSYSLAVRGYWFTTYSITLYYGDAVVTLEPGFPFFANVSQGQYSYFRALISGWQDLSVSVTEFVGDIGLTVASNVTRPTLNNGTWIVQPSVSRGAHVAISRADGHFYSGYYYIGVYGNQSSTFSVTYTTANTLLVVGQPQSSYCWGQPQYFFLNFQQQQLNSSTDTPSDISFVIQSDSSSPWAPSPGAHADFQIYIINDIHGEVTTQPNATVNYWTATLGDQASFTISHEDPFYCLENCTYYVTIGCPSNYYNSYSLTATTDNVPTVIFLDTRLEGSTPDNAEAFYQIYLSSATNFSFVLEPCEGEADLYVSDTYNRPDSEHHTIKLNNHRAPDVYDIFTSLSHTFLFFGVTPYNGISSRFRVYASYANSPDLATFPIIRQPLLTPSSSAGAIRVSFMPAVSALGTPSTALTYSVYYAPLNSESAIMYTQCGLQSKGVTFFANVSVDTDPSQLAVIEINGLDPQQSYMFNFLVSDPHPLCRGSSVYDFQSATPAPIPSPGGGGNNKLILGIAIPIAIVVVGLLVYLYIKNRRLSKELSIEMHDVPAASLRKAARGAPSAQPTTKQSKNFSKLLEDDDLAQRSDYAPPNL